MRVRARTQLQARVFNRCASLRRHTPHFDLPPTLQTWQNSHNHVRHRHHTTTKHALVGTVPRWWSLLGRWSGRRAQQSRGGRPPSLCTRVPKHRNEDGGPRSVLGMEGGGILQDMRSARMTAACMHALAYTFFADDMPVSAY